jgi:LysM repeat protein
MTWNNLKSQNILVGQKLKILSTSGETASTNETKVKPVSRPAITNSKTTTKPKGKYVWYTIKPGDNLWDIAEQYDATVSEIKKQNKITNTQRIHAGQKIRIEPGK